MAQSFRVRLERRGGGGGGGGGNSLQMIAYRRRLQVREQLAQCDATCAEFVCHPKKPGGNFMDLISFAQQCLDVFLPEDGVSRSAGVRMGLRLRHGPQLY